MVATEAAPRPPTSAELEEVINRPITPYLVVQDFLDQTADFQFYAEPDLHTPQTRTLTPGHPEDFFGINGGYGMDFSCVLRGFDARLDLVGRASRMRTGTPVGQLSARIYFTTDDAPYKPGTLPAPEIHDAWRSKRFVLTDAVCQFGHGESIRLDGVGRTYPVVVGGHPRLLVGASADVLEGTGRFKGLNGTLALNGYLTPELSFKGDITLRLPDFRAAVRCEAPWPSLQTPSPVQTGAVYLTLRGEKANASVRTTVGRPKGRQQQLITPSKMRPLEMTCAGGPNREIATAKRQGQVICDMDATVGFDLTAPRPTARSSVPFVTEEIYRFRDTRGREIGTIECGVEEGISFNLSFPGRPQQPGVRFAGCGPITGGSGVFEGARGILTVNSLIGISPHALSLIHVLHLVEAPRAWAISGQGRS